jgi:hypothetical protein
MGKLGLKMVMVWVILAIFFTLTSTVSAGASDNTTWKTTTAYSTSGALPPHHFELANISDQTVGAPFSINVKAVDKCGITVTSYRGRADLSDLSGSLIPARTTVFTKGVWTGQVTIPEEWNGDAITASDCVLCGTSNPFDVTVKTNPPETLASIKGLVYNDLNKNGSCDSGESGLSGVTVHLSNAPSTTTASDGSYTFTNLSKSSYQIVEIDPTGYQSSTPNEVNVEITSGTDYRVDFGDYLPYGPLTHFEFSPISNQTAGKSFSITIKALDENGQVVLSYSGIASLSDLSGGLKPLQTTSFTEGIWTGKVSISKARSKDTITAADCVIQGTSNEFNVKSKVNPPPPPPSRASIQGVVYNDLNKNGSRDTGEASLSGVIIHLGDSVVTTTSEGGYTFAGLITGSYRVVEDDPTGYQSSTPNEVTVNMTAATVYTVDFGDYAVTITPTPTPTTKPGPGGSLASTPGNSSTPTPTPTVTPAATLEPSPLPTVENTEDYLTVDFLGKISKGRISVDGALEETLLAESPDGNNLLYLEGGTRALDGSGQVIKLITVTEANPVPELPKDAKLMSQAFNFEPSGVVFNKAIRLTLGYDANHLPENIVSISLAYYRSGSGWTDLEPESGTVAELGQMIAPASHFTVFAVLARASSLSTPVSHGISWWWIIGIILLILLLLFLWFWWRRRRKSQTAQG